MSRPHEPLPAKLVVSVLSSELNQCWPAVLAGLADRFGPVEIAYPAMPFVHTAYYNDELGVPLVRRLFCFTELVSQAVLGPAKQATNVLEDRLGRPDGRRRVNLDPGLLTCERFVLATGKNFTHRIYLGDGIFGDLTLVFQAGSWQTLPWTFPDYAAPDMLARLTDIRCRYRRDLRERAVRTLSPKKELPCPKA
ncbi:DUF4416 family protein [Desulfovibrio sp. TomC]|uniref:DUF4416 family protein n=1 Tax=Desulfovibrio sp. TomC TaxID=1562888 RepID=UPI000575C9D0|nr:DUF4416 family protein [Desulfovibrio sp. TomC]KHK03512.1 hypothetical protein NY78_1100 [Desulfovibrio sp. TomC]